jgi:hypothetical protein
VVRALSQRLVNKLLHAPLAALGAEPDAPALRHHGAAACSTSTAEGGRRGGERRGGERRHEDRRHDERRHADGPGGARPDAGPTAGAPGDAGRRGEGPRDGRPPSDSPSDAPAAGAACVDALLALAAPR